jgi:hypothetical protein
MTKTFNIGEYAIGGRIKLTITSSVIRIQALDWNSKKVVMESEFNADQPGCDTEIDNYLHELTSSYWADQVMQWINTKIELKKKYLWY